MKGPEGTSGTVVCSGCGRERRGVGHYYALTQSGWTYRLKRKGKPDWYCALCSKVRDAMLKERRERRRAELESGLPRLRRLARRVMGLELTVLQRLKGEDEKMVRELIWEAHDILHPRRGHGHTTRR